VILFDFNEVYDVKSVSQPDSMPLHICKQLLISNDRNRGSLSCSRPLRGWGLYRDLFENLSVNSLKGDLSNAITFKVSLR
jgi:hypothetical protein